MRKFNILNGFLAITCLVLSGKLVAQVGVGTSTPTAGTKFEVVGAGTTSATTALRVRNSSSLTPLLMVRDDGNVGIGTTAPSAGLEIVTDGSSLNALRVATNQTYNTSPDVGIGFRFKYNTAGAYTSGAVISALKENNTDGDQSGSLRFWTTNSAGTIAERMRISSSGSVGIGNTAPNARLDIRTNPSSTSNPGEGYLGIGTTSTAANTAGAGAIRYSTSSGGVLQYSNGTAWNTFSSNVQKSLVSGYFNASTYGNTFYGDLTATEVLDVNNDFASSTFTAPRTGYYTFTATISSNSANDIMLNGTWELQVTPSSGDKMVSRYISPAASTNYTATVTGAYTVQLTAGATVKFQIYNSTGSSKTLAGQDYNRFSIVEN